MYADSDCKTDSKKAEKQEQAILFAIDRYPAINRTKLMKFIFFVDLFYYNKFYDDNNKTTRSTLLEDCYIRLPNGPVPKYGFEYTQPDKNKEETDKGLFTVLKIKTDDESKYYHYQFRLKTGVYPDLSYFNKVEIDLMNLTIQSIMLRRTSYLSSLTHSYNLWKSYLNGAEININDFELKEEEMENLEKFLNTKIYLIPVNYDNKPRKKMKNLKNNQSIYEPPTKLPVYYNAVTKEQIEIRE